MKEVGDLSTWAFPVMLASRIVSLILLLILVIMASDNDTRFLLD